jgi:hypothetical protein
MPANRKLVVDCRQSGIRDDFWKYFRPRESVPFLTVELNCAAYDTVEVLPSALRGRVTTLHTEYSMQQGGFADVVSDVLVTFDKNQLHDAPLLVHEQGWTGGHFTSPSLLSRLRFSPLVQRDIKARLATLPEKYFGLHIRHTDYTTDYQGLVSSVKSSLDGQCVLVCSDNLDVIQFVQKELAGSRVVRLSTFQSNDGARLHYRDFGDGQYAANIELLADLCGLAMSEAVFFGNVREANRPSGFSMLAHYLNHHKHLVQGLLND